MIATGTAVVLAHVLLRHMPKRWLASLAPDVIRKRKSMNQRSLVCALSGQEMTLSNSRQLNKQGFVAGNADSRGGRCQTVGIDET